MLRTATPGTRRTRAVRTVLALAALPLLVAGCGGSDDEARVTEAPTATGQPGAGDGVSPTTGGRSGPADLTIAVDHGDGRTTTWRLTCEPAGGDHPDPAKACEVLTAKGEEALAPTPEDAMCSQVIGGPETARITGTWGGAEVDAEFSLTNGCEIGRWTALEGLLPKPSGP